MHGSLCIFHCGCEFCRIDDSAVFLLPYFSAVLGFCTSERREWLIDIGYVCVWVLKDDGINVHDLSCIGICDAYE